MRRFKDLSIILLLSSAVFPIGCVKQQTVGDTTIYATEVWVIVVVGLAAVMVCVLGWYVRRIQKWLGYLLLLGGVLVLCTTVPGLAISGTTVDSDHVEWNRGLHHFSFRFEELGGIEHTVKKIPLGRTIQDVHYLEFTKKSGDKFHVQVEPYSDRFLQDAIPEIIRRARERGVPCTEKGPD